MDVFPKEIALKHNTVSVLAHQQNKTKAHTRHLECPLIPFHATQPVRKDLNEVNAKTQPDFIS